MTRAIIKAAQWTLGPETAEGAPTGIYSAECLTCGAQAQPTDDERLPVEVWALKHTGLNPTHRQFKATAETFWRVTPTGDNPYREGDAQTARQERAARMRWRGVSFELIAQSLGYPSADDAQKDVEQYETARALDRESGIQGA